MPAVEADAGVRRAEIVMVLSHATDLAIGQPVEYALKACVLGTRLGAALGLDSRTVREIYYQALLRYIGCNAETDALSALVGDEIAFRSTIATLDMGDPADLGPALVKAIVRAQAGQAFATMLWGVARGIATSRRLTVNGFRAHCEAAQHLARRLGFDEPVVHNLSQFQERWDGKGLPSGLKGESISQAVRVVALAHDAVVLEETYGRDATLAAAKKRRGKLYDPRVADVFIKNADSLLGGLATSSTWDAVVALEPEGAVRLDEAELDEACSVLADFVDLKSPFTSGHSRKVASIAAQAGRLRGMPAADTTVLRRAGLLHDIGQAGISSGILAKPGPLSESEWEKVRLHPYHAERILGRPAVFARVAQVVSRHHERLDGSGYHRGAQGDELSSMVRILTAAEVYTAMSESRPHRAALTADEAAAHVRREVREGRLDGDAVAAVLDAAGHRVPLVRKDRIAGLTSREIEVLRLVTRGQTMKEIGAALGISPKTVDNHLQSLYAKIGVKTRAGATLFAVENGLIE
ncbi:MAG: HD domain-containing protein [Deltaproteobacteria bacterium]|nr:HD domain-containing protein [Deltaproteobacteria bacterium]